MLTVLDQFDAKLAPFVIPVTNGFHVVPFPGLTLSDAMAIRSGFMPDAWRGIKPVFVSPSKIMDYLRNQECLAFQTNWSRDHFKVAGEYLNDGVQILTGFQSELCAKFYSAKALTKIRSSNRTQDPAKKAEPKLVELYLDFLKSNYGTRADSVVSEIRRSGISSAAYSINALGATPYQSWLTETLGSKRSDPDKARNLRLLARSRR